MIFSPNPVYLSNHLLSSFEPGDERRLNWVDSVIVGTDTFYFPYKYKSATEGDLVTEYQMVLRLGETISYQGPEARAHQENLAGALSDLNAIRSRAARLILTLQQKMKSLPLYSMNDR